MKKTLFLAILAGAALAGCVKNEEAIKSDTSPERIKFDAPVVSVPTRATEIYGNYPKDKDFAVYALHHEDAYDKNSFTTGSMYMTDVRCTYKPGSNSITIPTGETEPTDYWAPAAAYYWPTKGYLTFAAYAPARIEGDGEGANTGTGKVWDGATVGWNENGFKFTNFKVMDEPEKQIDLLYSERCYDQQNIKNNSTDNDNNVVTNRPYDGITIPFKHALSSILFTVKTEADYSSTTTIKLISIKVNNVVNKGTFEQKLTDDITGDTDATKPQWTVDANTDANGDHNPDNVKPSYTVYSVPVKTDESGNPLASGELDLAKGKTVTSTEQYVNDAFDGKNDDGTNEEYGTNADNEIPKDPNKENNGIRRSDLIVIPQYLIRGDEATATDKDKVTVTIVYTMKNNDESEPIIQPHTFQLAVADNDDEDSNPQYVWEMGKRYTYNIVIGLNKIYFNPQVTNWDNEIGTAVEIK